MKLDLYSVVELFRKSFSTSLSDEESEVEKDFRPHFLMRKRRSWMMFCEIII